MATTFDIDAYTCTDPPPYLWRVMYPTSQSREDPITGDLVAVDRSRTFTNEPELKQAIEKHLNWYSREPSCFVSTLSNEPHAYNWAKRRGPSGSSVSIHKIDTALLPTNVYLFDLHHLRKQNILQLPSSPDTTHEFLFLHLIPARSIIGVQSMEDNLESGTYHIQISTKGLELIT